VPDAALALVDRLDRLTEAVLTLAAIEVAAREALLPDEAALRVAHQRHEVQHALRSWQPPADSYRARDLS
jgi:hypothetical protein